MILTRRHFWQVFEDLFYELAASLDPWPAEEDGFMFPWGQGEKSLGVLAKPS
jgi:hypothetical protein